MKKLMTLFIFISLMQMSYADSWTQKASLIGGERDCAFSFTIGSKGYVGCGIHPGLALNDFWEYNPISDTWTQKANYGGLPCWYAVGFSIMNKGYAGLGYKNGTWYNDFWEYDPSTNNWTAKNNFTDTLRSQTVSLSTNTNGYICTGIAHNFTVYMKDIFEYNPILDTWNKKSYLSGASRGAATGFSISDKLYIATGLAKNNVGQFVYFQDLWEFDPATDTWTQKSNFGGIGRASAAAFTISGKGYIGLGFNGSNSLGDFWQYDPQTNVWQQKANYAGSNVYSASSFAIGNKGYFGFGAGTSSLNLFNDWWEYTPDSTTGIFDLQYTNDDLQVIPNPAKDFIKISINSNQQKIAGEKIIIADMAGKIFYASTITGNEMVIDVKHFDKGVYTLQLQNNNKIQTAKFIKQ